MTLTEFLLARIAEDEAVARAARMKSGEWDASEVNDNPRERLMTGAEVVERESGYLVTANTRWPGMLGNDGVAIPPGPTGIDQLAHVARHDPARVLAECEAKRRIVELHQSSAVLDHYEFDCTCGFGDHRLSRCSCGARTYDEGEWRLKAGPCPTLAALALPYADHADHQEEWKP